MARENPAEVVVVTGASAGVGRATARAFAARGAAVGLVARDRERLEETRREVEDRGGRGLALPADVAREDEVEVVAQTAERELGPIDVWVNCAMTSVFSPAHEMQPAEYRRVTEVNYLGYVFGTLAALRRMRQRDRGAIVQVSSSLGLRAIPLQSAYCASKSAIIRFTEALRCELIHDRSQVRLSLVHMPALNTPQFDWVRSRLPRRAQPVPPIFQPEVAAEAIVWAAHHRRRAIAVGGSSLQAILGNKIFPGLLDRYLAKKGYEAQQTDEPADPNRPDNLWEPVPGDFGAHGRFDARARSASHELWLSEHRVSVGLVGMALAAVGALAAVRAARG
jgi:NAD(P)-dependent dehydrogenase (short-subunit alcohol dehydrogenase family)